jgi:hypothetical protein
MSFPPITKLDLRIDAHCAVRLESIHKHFDFFALNITLNPAANLSHADNKRRMAPAVGASNATSSAYANAPQNQLPIKHPMPSALNANRRLSKYMQKRTGLNIAPCFTPLETEKLFERKPFQSTRTCCPV